VRVTLPQADIAIPLPMDRINPVFFQEAPEAWLNTRPEPQDDLCIFTPVTTVRAGADRILDSPCGGLRIHL
jgi:hypothetical protein